jgi:hypothetical protein
MLEIIAKKCRQQTRDRAGISRELGADNTNESVCHRDMTDALGGIYRHSNNKRANIIRNSTGLYGGPKWKKKTTGGEKFH